MLVAAAFALELLICFSSVNSNTSQDKKRDVVQGMISSCEVHGTRYMLLHGEQQ